MELSTRTAKALEAANISDPSILTDEEILAVEGIGEKGLAEIRAAVGEHPAASETDEPSTATPPVPEPDGHSSPSGSGVTPEADESDATVDHASDPAATGSSDTSQPACQNPSPSGARCWQVTRSRYVGGKRERYCETCGAVESRVTLTDRGFGGR